MLDWTIYDGKGLPRARFTATPEQATARRNHPTMQKYGPGWWAQGIDTATKKAYYFSKRVAFRSC